MTLPLDSYAFKFANFKGLSADPGDWITFDRTTLFVGRNNVGKSTLIQALKFFVDQSVTFNPEWNRAGSEGANFAIRHLLDERSLRRAFPENTSGGVIGGNHWSYGQKYIGREVVRKANSQRQFSWAKGPGLQGLGN